MSIPSIHRLFPTSIPSSVEARRTATHTMTSTPEQILEHLYDEHGAGVYRWAAGMLSSREDAEDLVQAIWLRLADRKDHLQGIENLEAYLWQTARNAIHSRLRRRRLERWFTPAFQDEAEPPPSLLHSDSVSLEVRRDLERTLARLSPRVRSAVVMVGLVGWTLEEAAERLGIPRGTVASRYHRGLRQLERRLTSGRTE